MILCQILLMEEELGKFKRHTALGTQAFSCCNFPTADYPATLISGLNSEVLFP